MNIRPLNILLVFRNEPEKAREFLSKVYALPNDLFSLFVVDDASDDDTYQVIDQRIKDSNHQFTYFFDNPTPLGRLRSIKELIPLLEGNVFWAPTDFEADFDTLHSILRSLISDRDLDYLPNSSPPTETIAIPGSALEDQLQVEDEFNAALEIFDESRQIRPWIDRRKKRNGISGDDLGHPLRCRFGFYLPTDSDTNTLMLFEELRPLVEKYDIQQAFERLNRLLIIPSKTDTETLSPAVAWLKVVLLESMGKFVQASELRYRLFMQETGSWIRPIRHESIVIVHPNEHNPEEEYLVDDPPLTPKKRFINTDLITMPERRQFDEVAVDAVSNSNPDSAFPEQVTSITQEDIPDQLYTRVEDVGSDSEMVQNQGLQQPVQSVVEVVKTVDHSLPELEHQADSDDMDSINVESSTIPDTPGTISTSIQIPRKPSLLEKIESRFLHSTPNLIPPDSTATVSVIIPTALIGLPVLEVALESLQRYAPASVSQLIVVDNGSLDKTKEYLIEYSKSSLFPLHTITNKVNKGFAYAVNQGLEHAKSTYVVVMHNDVRLLDDAITPLIRVLENHPEIALVGPNTESAFKENKPRKAMSADIPAYKLTDYVESFFMVIRRIDAVNFSESYGLCWFEDIDYGMRLAQKGFKTAHVSSVKVGHSTSYTIKQLGRDTYHPQFWKNSCQLELSWSTSPEIPDLEAFTSVTAWLIAVSNVMNPYIPEEKLIGTVRERMTSELRNRIAKEKFNVEDTLSLIRLMLNLDFRDLLRTLEERLRIDEIDDFMVYLLVEFYQRKRIYSRCEKYYNALAPHRRHYRIKIVMLRVYLASSRIDDARNLLQEVFNLTPASPDVLKITAELHQYQGNLAEADAFNTLADMIDPYT